MRFGKKSLPGICIFLSVIGSAQKETVDTTTLKIHLNFLASDSLKGRANFSDEILIAANYIAVAFTKSNLKPLVGFFDHYVPFNGGSFKNISRDKVVWNDQALRQNQFVYFTTEKIPSPKTLKDFKLVEISGKLPDSIFYKQWNEPNNVLIWWNGNKSKDQKINIQKLLISDVQAFSNVLLVSSKEKPASVELKADDNYKKNILFNIVGVLPGKTKPSEVVIFSAHYDHIGIDRSLRSDSIFNGANDNASGVAALLSLAEYYAEKNDNERTLLFCAFAGEELGLLGSRDLAEIIKPGSVKAMINLEMLGRNTIGKQGDFFITGDKYSDLKDIIKKEMDKIGFSVLSEPPGNSLFLRSDNYPFAVKGIPAHTIMTSLDDDRCYHQPCDDLGSIDINSIKAAVQNIITGCEKIVSGLVTPRRIMSDISK